MPATLNELLTVATLSLQSWIIRASSTSPETPPVGWAGLPRQALVGLCSGSVGVMTGWAGLGRAYPKDSFSFKIENKYHWSKLYFCVLVCSDGVQLTPRCTGGFKWGCRSENAHPLPVTYTLQCAK